MTDIHVPDMDGYEIAARMREQKYDPPPTFVALTGWAQWKDKELAQKAGFDRYIVKPVTHDTLESLLAGLGLVTD